MTLTQTPPKHGYRGDVSLALQRRESPHADAHARSLSTPTPPLTWEACVAWFKDAWEASLPTRLHTRGVEDGSALGSPRMAGAMHARTDHVDDKGWGVTGWDRQGQPRGMTDDGTLTRDPFLFYLELRLRREDPGAHALVRWAYMGWSVEDTALSLFRRTLREGHPILFEVEALRSLLEVTIKRLWHDCQREPVRYSICRGCRRRECVCGQRSEAQVNAEEAAG